MREQYDFSNAVRNPHAGKFKDGYTIIVEHKDYDEVITVTKTKRAKTEKTDESSINDELSATKAANL